MKMNLDEFHLSASCNNNMSICISNHNIGNSKWETFLETKIDHKLNFDTYIDEICKRVGQKLIALSTEAP